MFTLRLLISGLLLMLLSLSSLSQTLDFPKVPYPTENLPNEAKRVLGKILFWEEQLSTDNSISCGSCHIPASGGADPRIGLAPGYDNQLNTKDDIRGSLGVVARDTNGHPIADPVFQFNNQVTTRTAQPFFSGIWANSNFWDGRATGEFIDPQTGHINILQGGALENQVLGPLMSEVEMAKQGQTAEQVIEKLRQAKPLALADKLPSDIQAVLAEYTSYPELFEKAFGVQKLSLARIAFAIATYERSLIADKTPWDQAQNSGDRLPYLENLGWEFFKQKGCVDCHTPPLFTDNQFYNVGIQGQNADIGRQMMTGLAEDVGKMKTPSLRNVGLKSTFMHTGEFTDLDQVLDAYIQVPFKNVVSKLPNGGEYDFDFTESQRKAVIAFITLSLTDVRVKNELFPFDRPKLRRELNSGYPPQPLTKVRISLNQQNQPVLVWSEKDLRPGEDVEIVRNGKYFSWASRPPFTDIEAPPGIQHRYTLSKRNAQMQHSDLTLLIISTPAKLTWKIWFLFAVLATLVMYFLIRHRP